MTTACRPFEGKTVAFDLDGPVHSYTSGWTGPVPLDPPTPGSREAMQWFIDRGATIVIFTTRASTEEGLAATMQWMHEYDYPEGIVVTDRKVPAIAYIDDRGIHFDPARPDWGDVQERALALAQRR